MQPVQCYNGAVKKKLGQTFSNCFCKSHELLCGPHKALTVSLWHKLASSLSYKLSHLMDGIFLATVSQKIGFTEKIGRLPLVSPSRLTGISLMSWLLLRIMRWKIVQCYIASSQRFTLDKLNRLPGISCVHCSPLLSWHWDHVWYLFGIEGTNHPRTDTNTLWSQ